MTWVCFLWGEKPGDLTLSCPGGRGPHLDLWSQPSQHFHKDEQETEKEKHPSFRKTKAEGTDPPSKQERQESPTPGEVASRGTVYREERTGPWKCHLCHL